ncbi:hypothetical protein [Jiella marina]|uniref:hypothetical protein n=1 Tax=Jiella sp. LLJ827 TaxID=2917712 RepID=UPI00210100E6|nr:hypothetical protein [Jiella sp. LLJ827]MCQ0989589.1 hypothetical protein [Jiella sp. LLJ827]
MIVLRYLSLILWVAAPAAALGIYAGWGVPHVIFQYTYRDNGHPHDLTVPRHYLTCTFVGPYGAITVAAERAKCGWVRFFKDSADQ